MTAWILLNILVVFSILNCICGKNFRTLSHTVDEISRKQFLKKFIKNFQTNKNQFWVLLIGFSYLSQNSSFKSKNLVLYLKMLALQNGNIFIQIWKFDWAAISAFRRGSRAVTQSCNRSGRTGPVPDRTAWNIWNGRPLPVFYRFIKIFLLRNISVVLLRLLCKRILNFSHNEFWSE